MSEQMWSQGGTGGSPGERKAGLKDEGQRGRA